MIDLFSSHALVGYAALVLNLVSMTMKDVLKLRSLSLTANALYIIYGILIGAAPLMIGCTIAVVIHGYHIIKIYREKKADINAL